MVPPWGDRPRARQSGGFICPASCSAGSRTWCTLFAKRTVRSPPYTTHYGSVNAGEPRPISGIHGTLAERKAGTRLGAMTPQARGGEQTPAAEQPHPAAEEPPPAAAPEPALNPLQRL